MKHNFLRRAGALFLALALVLPMAVPTAWAAPGDAFGVTLPSTLDLTVNGDPCRCPRWRHGQVYLGER